MVLEVMNYCVLAEGLDPEDPDPRAGELCGNLCVTLFTSMGTVHGVGDEGVYYLFDWESEWKKSSTP